MLQTSSRQTFVVLALILSALGCNQNVASDIQIEKLPDVRPTLPEVPRIPPPAFPEKHPDGAYSVYGLRRKMGITLDTDVSVAGYIVNVYRRPECPEGRTCPPGLAPNIYIADSRTEQDTSKWLQVAGYAENQDQVDEARELAARGRYTPPEPESGLLPIPTDFDQGAKVKITGRFTRVSGAGFRSSEGLMEYRSHERLEAPPAQ